jgi:hypothetical protein
MKTVRGTHHDLAACYAWKQVGLGFPSLPQDWWRHGMNGAHGIIIEVALR